MKHNKIIALLFFIVASATVALGQIVTFEIVGTNPHCQSQYPNGVPYSGRVTNVHEAYPQFDVDLQVQKLLNGSWINLGAPFNKSAYNNWYVDYNSDNLNIPHLSTAQGNVLRMQATVHYRSSQYGVVLTSVVYSNQVDYIVNSPILEYTVDGNIVSPTVPTEFSTGTGTLTMEASSATQIPGPGVQWKFEAFHSDVNGTEGSPFGNYGNCGYQAGVPPEIIIISDPYGNGSCTADWFALKDDYIILKLSVQNNCGSVSQKALLHFTKVGGSSPGVKDEKTTPCPANCNVCPWDCSPASHMDPYIYPGECSIGLDRYLSRNADAGGLHLLIFENGDRCEFSKMIESLSNMNIQFIQRAYSGANGQEHRFFPNEEYYRIGFEIVNDINKTYDCKGLPRPVIQATFDLVNPDNFDNMKKWPPDPNHPSPGDVIRNIPVWIIEKYFQYYPEDRHTPEGEYYFLNDVPIGTHFFEKNRVFKDGKFNINSIEMRMWCLYVTFTEIDMGYTAIHMGVYYDWSDNKPDGSDPGNKRLIKLTNVIRDYATCKGTFVILSGETPMASNGQGGSAHYFVNGDDTPHFIFDFDSRAMRPREFTMVNGDPNQVDWSDGDGDNCTLDGDQNFVDALADPDCPCHDFYIEKNLMAVVDPCTINSFGGTMGGISPLGCYVSQQPYSVHFDGNSPAQNPGVASDGPGSLTFGYHDNYWFSLLPESCKSWWFNYFYCDRRQFHDGNGFITIPAINYIYDDNLFESFPTLHICNETDLENGIKNNTLAVKQPTMIVDEDDCYPNKLRDICNGETAPNGTCFLVGKKCYTIRVGNTDCSSKYSIHVKDPNGKYLPQELGEVYHLCPNIEGTYQVSIRQDNLGITTPGKFGTYEFFVGVPVEKECCERIEDCHYKSLTTTQRCVENTPDKRVYGFDIESDISNQVSNLSVKNKFYTLKNVVQSSANKISGLVEIRDAAVEDLELFVEVNRGDAGTRTEIISEALMNCEGQNVTDRTSKSTNPAPQTASLGLFPNPASTSVKIQYSTPVSETVNVLVFNNLMQVISHRSYNAEKGDNLWEYNVSDLPKGSYFLVLKSGQNTFQKPFLKME